MTLTLDAILRSAGIDLADSQAIRHGFVHEDEDTGLPGMHADSTDEEILAYTSRQSAKPRIFPTEPPKFWVVFIRDGGAQARLWSVLENRGEVSNGGAMRTCDLVSSERLADLQNRLVIGWRSPQTGRLNGPTAAGFPVVEIADAQPVPKACGSAGGPIWRTATVASSSYARSIRAAESDQRASSGLMEIFGIGRLRQAG